MWVSSSGRGLNAEVMGQGEPVLTIHGAFFGKAFDPLARKTSISDHHKVIVWERYGYGASDKPQGPYALQDVVADAAAVLDAAGEERAHVVAHSAGCIPGLQLALAHPEKVQTLTLIEPVLPTPEWNQFAGEHFVPAGARLQAGDASAALDTCFGPIYGGLQYKQEMDGCLPDGWYEQALADLPNLFLFESPALRELEADSGISAELKMPVMVVEGENTEPVWVANSGHFLDWVPQAEHRILPGGIHMSPVVHPEQTAEILGEFFERHSLSATR